MSVDDRRRKIDALIASVPPVIRPLHDSDSCVLSSHVGRDLLREVGVDARLTPCRVAVFNRQMREIIGPDVGRLVERWTPDEEQAAQDAGAWCVMIGWSGQDPDDDRFDGHVVLTVHNPDGIVDLTLDQTARPDYGIHVEPAFLPIDRAGLRDFFRQEGAAGYTEQDHGAGIVYVYAPDREETLRTSPDLALPTPGHRLVHQRTVDACRRAFEKSLASSAPGS